MALGFFRNHLVVAHADRITGESAIVLWYPCVGKAGWILISLLYLSSFSTQYSLKLRNKFGTAKKFTWLKSSYSNFFPPLSASSIKNTIILSFLLSFSWKNSYLFFLIVIQQANLLTIALHYNCKNQFLSVVFVEIEFSLIDKCSLRLSLAYFFLSYNTVLRLKFFLFVMHLENWNKGIVWYVSMFKITRIEIY